MTEKKTRKPIETPYQKFAKALKAKYGDKIRISYFTQKVDIGFAPSEETAFGVTRLQMRTIDDNYQAAVDIVTDMITKHPKAGAQPKPKPAKKPEPPKQESEDSASE